jgi:inner membrane protein
LDPFTHVISGAVAGRATTRTDGDTDPLSARQRTLCGALAAGFPDIDYFVILVDTLTYLNLHRGITHSLLMVPLWAGLLALVFGALYKRRWQAFYFVCVAGLTIHIVGDVLTPYGTKIFAPFSDYRFTIWTTFVIDPILTGLLVSGLVVSVFVPRIARVAQLTLLAVAGYVGIQMWLHRNALDVANNFAMDRSLSQSRAYALPQPLSPFHWKLVLKDADGYWEARVNLIGRVTRQPRPAASSLTQMWASFHPQHAPNWQRIPRYGATIEDQALAHAAWSAPALHGFRLFALFPVAYKITRSNPRTCVYFQDLRFSLAGRTPPFRFGACRPYGSNTWKLVRDS